MGQEQDVLRSVAALLTKVAMADGDVTEDEKAEILDYFNTITLGLTATPTDIIDHNTFQLFHCENGLPTFAYTFEEAVNNEPPYLCNFQVMKIKTKFQEEGINKRTIALEDQKTLILEGKDQIRGWFNLLMICSTIAFDMPAFKSVYMNEL